MTKSGNTAYLRRKVAREAALLLYTLQEKEFKQAKEKAAKTFGLRVLPSNFEVAEELDRIADEYEGEERWIRLIRMRKEALEIMETLSAFHPRLIGSVWRGTANKHSDIDIVVFSQEKEAVIETLRKNGLKILDVKTAPSEKEGRGETIHIFIDLPSKDRVEVIVRGLEDMNKDEICDIYGDVKRGLTIKELRDVLEKDPLRRFIPKRRKHKYGK
ncbi:MAG: nucleotidyltransferase domain-containing protein [Candidatus Bathyarchaeia archaeon]|nr:nucleotidyltransferase domain-containing protein [Candidatus Bathyarchaeota archaeon]